MTRKVAFALLLAGSLAGAARAQEFWPRIREIRVEAQPLFTEDERLDEIPGLPDLTFIFEVANDLHIDTREHVVRRELLFAEGDLADPELLAESERNLRNLSFLRDVNVRTIPVGPGEVDVVVETRDTWTTEPRISFSSGGGTEQSEFGLVEKNLFGYGKRLVLRRQSEIDRDSNQLQYDDPRLFGSRWRFLGNFEDTSDGHVLQGLAEYPFFALDTPWAGGVRYSSIRERNRIFDDGGVTRSRFRREQEFVDARVGGLLPGSTDFVVRRLGVFYRHLDDDFASRGSGRDREFVPEDRRQSVPGLFFQRQEVRFVKERHFNLFDRVEDLNLGNVLDVELGLSSEALGARDDEPILTATNRQGLDFGPGQKAFLFGFLSGRHRGNELRNAVLSLEAISFNRWRLLFEHTFVARVKLDLARELDRDAQLFLGNDNGLRGYDTREFVGARRFVFNFEDRIFFVNDLFHLVSLGAVVFFDSGYTWDEGESVNPRDVASSVGIGLRLGLPRAANEKIFRIDLAIPLSTAGGDHLSPGISFGSGQAFQPFAGPFDLQSSGS